MDDNRNKLVEDYWSKFDGLATEKNFYCFPPIRSRSCKLIFDEYDASRKDWCQYWTVEKYLKNKIPFEKCLSICCGFGEIERSLSRLNVAKKIVGMDIAPGAVEKAKVKAKEQGLNNIDYYVGDLNNDDIPENEYDLIWANGALHHIDKLEVVIPKLKNALKSGGFLVANEYVGNNYQQVGKRQQELINSVRHLLPDELCQKEVVRLKYPEGNSILMRGIRFIKRKLYKYWNNNYSVYEKIWEPPSIEYFLKNDPSEGINSQNIIPTLKKHFDNIDVKYFDGSILMYVLDAKFYDNFDINNTSHRKILQNLFEIEDTYIQSGDLSRDNAHIICKKE
jgi:ubiquinone/menaquinone biosynthesis C-methylase UbiE